MKTMNFDHYITKINTSNRPLFKSFTESINSEHLKRLNSISIKTYFVAMTPRSGSSYFVDLLKKNKPTRESKGVQMNILTQD